MGFRALPNPGNKPGTIEVTEDSLYKVTFVHEGDEHILGLFSTLDESHRVCDVLAIKATVDAGGDLGSLNLHCDLHRYGVDQATAGEIRSVSFRQVVRDLQVCSTQPLAPLAPEETTSWAALGMNMSVRQEPAGSAAATNSHALRQPAPSIARAAFHQAGAANAAAAVAQMVPAEEEGVVEMEQVPSQLRGADEVAGGVQQEQQQARAQGGLPAQRPNQLDALLESSADLDAGLTAQPPRWHGGPMDPEGVLVGAAPEQPQPQHDGLLEPSSGLKGPPDAAATQSDSRKRRRQDASSDAEEERDGDEPRGRGRQSAGQPAGGQGLEDPGEAPPAGGPGTGTAAVRDGGGKRRKSAAGFVPGERPYEAADALAFTAANHPFHGITVPAGSTKMFAQVVVKHNDDVVARGGREKKNLRFASCATAAEAAVAWDLGAIWRAIQYGEDPAALDAAPRPGDQLNFAFSRYAALLPTLRECATGHALRAAVIALRDKGRLAQLASGGRQPPGSSRRDSQAGSGRPGSSAAAPPVQSLESEQGGEDADAQAQEGTAAGEGEEEEEDDDEAQQAQQKRRRLAAPPLPQRHQGEPAEEEQEEEPRQQQQQQQQQQAGEEGGLPAAEQGRPPGAGETPKSPAATGKQRGRRHGWRRGPGAFRGVSGKGPWTAQIVLRQAKVLDSKARLWEAMRADVKLIVRGCRSHAVAAACADLLLLWRCQLYGDDPAEADLNLPLERYRHLLPPLGTLGSSAVAPHVQRLRDDGSLNAVVLGMGDDGSLNAVVLGMGDGTADAAAGQPPSASVATGTAPAAEQLVEPVQPPLPGGASEGTTAQRSPRMATAGGQQQQQVVAEPTPQVPPPQSLQQQQVVAKPTPPQSRQQQQQQQQQQVLHEQRTAAAAADVAAGEPTPGRWDRLQRMSTEELRQALYDRSEQGRVALQQGLYERVEGLLSGLQPEISEEQAVAYMGQFLMLRDLRSLLYRRLTDWHAAGRRDLLLSHVRSVLRREQGQGHEAWLEGGGD